MVTDLNDRLAERLKQLRTSRGWSLQELADKSGVSRSTLSRIENGEVSPTAETLGSLSRVYQTTITQLLAPLEAPFAPLIRRERQSVWSDKASGFTRRMVSPPGGTLSAEVIRGDIAANRTLSYDAPSVPGHEHHLVLISGSLTVTVESVAHDLAPGDCLRYQLFGASKFQTGADPASYLLFLV